MNIQQINALRKICIAVIETVRECPAGAPAGPLYAGLATQGCNKQQFDSLMDGLCKNGYLRQEGFLYFTGPKTPTTPTQAEA